MLSNHGDSSKIEIKREPDSEKTNSCASSLRKYFHLTESEFNERIPTDVAECLAEAIHERDAQQDDGSHLGFRHLFRRPWAHERFAGYGLGTEDEVKATTTLLFTLSTQISKNDVAPSDTDWQNIAISAGYTYLFQLVGHDMVHTAPSLPPMDGGRRRHVNLRRAQLELETIYGGGPTVSPFAYEVPDRVKSDRTKLKMGRMQWKDKDVPQEQCPFLDIPRFHDATNSGRTADGMPDVLIADPRNDDNVILSQMTALFHQLHNIVLEKLPEDDGAFSGLGTPERNRFSRARNVVVQVYRNIIRNDLMCKLLHPAMHAHYKNRNHCVHHHANDHRVSLEFAHAVCRVGHAMIRPEYHIRDVAASPQSLNEVIKTNSSRSPDRMPLSEEWIVDWALFFDMRSQEGGPYPAPNHSARLQPHLVSVLAGPTLIDPPGELPIEGSSGLYFRDLMRGASAGLWSVPALQKRLETSDLHELVKKCNLLSNSDHRHQAIKDWLLTCKIQLLDEHDREQIAKDPPLLFYVLFEAATKHQGRHLGILGSIIIAEAVFSALSRRPVLLGQPNGDISDQTDQDCEAVFIGPAPADMPTFIKFVADNGTTLPPA